MSEERQVDWGQSTFKNGGDDKPRNLRNLKFYECMTFSAHPEVGVSSKRATKSHIALSS